MDAPFGPLDGGAVEQGATEDLSASDGDAILPRRAWARAFGGLQRDRAKAVVVDGAGNIYVAGEFIGPLNFGGEELVSVGSYDLFLVSFAPDGGHRWSKRFGGLGGETSVRLALDGSGNIYLAGSFIGSIDFGGQTLTSSAQSSIYLASLTSAGEHRWSQSFGGTRRATGHDLTVDSAGNVILCGAFQTTINFGGENLTSAYYARYDAYLASFTSDGQHSWSQRFGNSVGHAWGSVLATDVNGNIAMAGLFQDNVAFGADTLTSAGEYDIVLASFSSAGDHRWSQNFGGPTTDRVSAVATMPNGDITISGYFADPLDFGGGSLKSAGSDDIYLATFDADGGHRWSRRFGGASGDYGNALAVTAEGNLLLAGDFGDVLSFGEEGQSLTSVGAYDAYIASFSADGECLWSESFGGSSWDHGRAIAAGPKDDVVLTGFFEGSSDFGGVALHSAGLQDIFVIRLVE